MTGSAEEADRRALRRFGLYIALALLAALPGIWIRFSGVPLAPVAAMGLLGIAILSAGFLLSWGAEAAEEHIAQGLAMAVLALITVLPEYAVDIYYAFQAGRHPASDYGQYAAANMTGANRLLIGVAWPLIALLYRARSGRRAVALRPANAIEIVFLALPSLYAFVVVGKGSLSLLDTVVLGGMFAAYLWRVGRLQKAKADEDAQEDADEAEVGPAAALEVLPKAQQIAVMAALTMAAALIILAVAGPFAESLIAAGKALGIDRFLLIQWVGPLASEAAELVIVVLFTLSLRPTAALSALISDKINQWTLLVGMIPLVYSLAAHHTLALTLDARQHAEFFLTAAQSLFAVGLLLRLRLSVKSGLILLALFTTQLCLGYTFRHDAGRSLFALNGMAWLYLGLTAPLLVWNRAYLAAPLRFGLLARPLSPSQPND